MSVESAPTGREARPPGALEKETIFPFTEDDFERVRALIYRYAGIALSDTKKEMVYSRLARRLRAHRVDSFAAYLAILDAREEEIEEFINSLTTNLTSFFREPHHFPILAEHLGRVGNRGVSIWTCAASTGEEPYSIAMTALQALPEGAALRILATDIDTRVLSIAREGIYPIEQLQKVPAELQRRFFLKGEGKNEGFARVREELKRLIAFKKLNLLDAKYPFAGRFDAIFCRNVMIYFDKETQNAVLRRMVPFLKPDGLLFVGHSENFHHASDLLRLCGNTVYTHHR